MILLVKTRSWDSLLFTTCFILVNLSLPSTHDQKLNRQTIPCCGWAVLISQDRILKSINYWRQASSELPQETYFYCTRVSRVFLASWFSPWCRSAWGTYTVHTTHWNPLQYSRLENPTDRGALQATVCGATRVGHNSALNHHDHHPLEQRITRKQSFQKNPSCSLTPDSKVYSNNSSKAFNAFKNSSSPILKNCFFWNFFFFSQITQAMYLGSHDWVRLVWWEDIFFSSVVCLCLVVGRTLNMRSSLLTCFKGHHTVLLTTDAVLYNQSLELTHLEKLKFHTHWKVITHPSPSGPWPPPFYPLLPWVWLF